MKKFIVLILLLTAFASTGCAGSRGLAAVNENNGPTSRWENSNNNEDKTDTKETNTPIEFALMLGDKKVSLGDWDDKVDLEAVFGKALNEKNEKLGSGSDTFTGSFIKEVNYDGIALKLFSPKDNGKTFYVFEMEVTGTKYQTVKGIKVGDSLDVLNKTYPAVKPVEDGNKDVNNRNYVIKDESRNFMVFEVMNGVIRKIRIYNEFA